MLYNEGDAEGTNLMSQSQLNARKSFRPSTKLLSLPRVSLCCCILVIASITALVILLGQTLTIDHHLPQPTTSKITAPTKSPTPKSSHQFSTEEQGNLFEEQAEDTSYFPKKIWIYPNGMGEIHDLVRNNIDHFALRSGYQVVEVNRTNYHKHLRPHTANKLTAIIKRSVQERRGKSLSQRHQMISVQALTDLAISFTLLEENGGMLLQEGMCLTEDLSWMVGIEKTLFSIRGERDRKTEVVGFYDPRFSSKPGKVTSSEPFLMPFSYYRSLPLVNPSIMIAIKKATFIKEISNELLKCLLNPEQVDHLMEEMFRNLGFNSELGIIHAISRKLFYYKDNDLKEQNIKGIKLTVDYYGVSLINYFEGPGKFHKELTHTPPSTIWQYFGRAPQSQFKAYFGELPYTQPLLHLVPHSTLQQVLQGRERVLEGSMFANLFPHLIKGILHPSSTVNAAKAPSLEWATVPKTVWIFLGNSYDDMNLLQKIAVSSSKNILEKAGYVVNLVNESQVKQHIDEFFYNDILEIVNRNPLKMQSLLAAELFGLAMLLKNGGISLSRSMLLEKDLSWVHTITNLSRQYIFNRFTPLPTVLSFFDPFQGGPSRWDFNEYYLSKLFNYTDVSTFLIASVPRATFINDWMNQSIFHLKQPSKGVLEIHSACKMEQIQGVVREKGRRAVSVIGGCVLKEKSDAIKDINTKQGKKYVNGAHFYQVWSLNSYLGPNKYSLNYQLDNQIPYRPFFNDYPLQYVEKVVGKDILPLRSLGSQEIVATTSLLVETESTDPMHAHPKSFFASFLNNHNLTLLSKMINGKRTKVLSQK